MINILQNIFLNKKIAKYIFLLLVLCYFSIGIYLAANTALTSDEPAYIGSSYFYLHGQGYNIEHPLLLKIANAVGLSLFFPDLQVPLPVIDPNDSLQVNLAPYTMGYKLLMSFPNRAQNVVFFSRIIYLLVNSFILFWFYLYTFILGKINFRLTLVFLILFVFSPSFYSHYYLITFDCSAAIYALLTVFSIAITLAFLTKWTKPELICQFAITSFVLFCAISVKFSNLILLPIVIFSYVAALSYLLLIRNYTLLRIFALLSSLSLLIQPILIASLYRYAFGSLPGQSFFDNLNRAFQGILKTKSMVDSVKEPFWNGYFVPFTYSQFISRIFWYKENPALFLLIIFYLVFLIFLALKYLRYADYYNKYIQEKYKTINNHELLLIIFFVLLFTAFPFTYYFVAKDSRFVIGYRHFYPVLIFIYLSLASLTLMPHTKKQKIFLSICLMFYIIGGILGVSQSLSYVNPFWRQDKWMLTNDSTLNWGQENIGITQYLIDNKILSQKDSLGLSYRTFGVVINIQEYLGIFNASLSPDIKFGYFEPLKQDISSLPYSYLLIDSTVLQDIYHNRKTNSIAASNYFYIIENNPVFQNNEIVFIYKLN